ncbi:hypothetical protein ACEWPL_014985 [Roseovarius sp. S1116L3]|uniref:hypothetical protein n=1 Tax=Roseovarius roseus TaxID=3342636 RepID=UPI003729CB1C
MRDQTSPTPTVPALSALGLAASEIMQGYGDAGDGQAAALEWMLDHLYPPQEALR